MIQLQNCPKLFSLGILWGQNITRNWHSKGSAKLKVEVELLSKQNSIFQAGHLIKQEGKSYHNFNSLLPGEDFWLKSEKLTFSNMKKRMTIGNFLPRGFIPTG